MAHTNDIVCLTVVVFLVRDNKVLLANHPRYNAWLPVGGHIDAGEDPDETLFREIKEETNLDQDDVNIFSDSPKLPEEETPRRFLKTPVYIDRHHVMERDHVAIVYFGEVIDGREALKSEEHKELRWFGEEEIHHNNGVLRPHIAWYALQALKAAQSK